VFLIAKLHQQDSEDLLSIASTADEHQACNPFVSLLLVNGFMLIHSSSPDDIYSFSFRSATCRRTVPCRIALPGSVLHHGRERNRGLGIRGYGMCLILSPVWTVFSISCQFTSL